MDKSITTIIEEVCEEICNKLCKYPSMFSPDEWEEKIDDICKDCPLNRLT